MAAGNLFVPLNYKLLEDRDHQPFLICSTTDQHSVNTQHIVLICYLLDTRKGVSLFSGPLITIPVQHKVTPLCYKAKWASNWKQVEIKTTKHNQFEQETRRRC